MKSGDVQSNAFTDQFFRFIQALPYNTKAGQSRRLCSPAAVLCLLVDDRIFNHALILDLPVSGCFSTSHRYIFSALTGDRNAAQLHRMLVLLMTSGRLHQIPAILLQ